MQVIKKATSLEPSAVDPLAKLLAQSFNVRDDPLYSALYSSVPDHEAFLELKFKSRVYESIRDDEVYSIEAAGLVAAAMIVVPPGPRRHREDTSSSAELKLMTPPQVADDEKTFHDRVDELEGDAYGDDTWYISFLATAPWARGKGLAGALIKHILDHARADGRLTTVTTATEGNIALYEKYGFKVIQTADLQIGRRNIELWAMDNAEAEGHL